MFCISNAIVWGEDRGGGRAYRVAEEHEQKTKRKCFQKSQFFVMGFFLDAVKSFGTSCCCKEDGVLGHRFNSEFIYFF